MSEIIRSVKVRIEVDTNKQTYVVELDDPEWLEVVNAWREIHEEAQ